MTQIGLDVAVVRMTENGDTGSKIYRCSFRNGTRLLEIALACM